MRVKTEEVLGNVEVSGKPGAQPTFPYIERERDALPRN